MKWHKTALNRVFQVFGLMVWSYLSISVSLGQNTASHTRYLLAPLPDTIFLDHQSIVPESESLWFSDLESFPENLYSISYNPGFLIVKGIFEDTLWLSYRFFLNTPQDSVFLRSFQTTLDTQTVQWAPDAVILPSDPDKNVFWPESGNIRKSGSLSRGLSLGNAQGLGVTSGLRLQLEGDLGDGLKIVGAITDENIPVQPDGSTQRISDLDKVFIRLSKNPYAVTLGDYEEVQRSTRFANYYRNVQGVKFQYEEGATSISLSAAVGKGRFHTNSFIAKEGVAGPYQLSGRNNELFFVILAGSERVYLNGRLMTRGENQDYVIDYNTAELTFTAKHVMTNVTRIVIDFEYTEQTYNRSLMTARLRQKFLKDRARVSFSYARDADNAQAPFDTTAFDDARDLLVQAGDTNVVFASGVRFLGKGNPIARYELRDTVHFGQGYEYFYFTRDTSKAEYQVSFLNVGQGNGQYRRNAAVSGENQFQWVGPDSLGQLQGNYEPLRQWVLPKNLQVFDFLLEGDVTKNITGYSELSISQNDQNRLSSIGDSDNTDLALRSGVKGREVRLGDSLHMTFDFYYQYVGERYTNLDRIYKAEYYRYWNLPQNDIRQNEHIGLGNIKLDFRRQLFLNSEAGIRHTGPGESTFRQAHTLSSAIPNFLQGSLTFTQIGSVGVENGSNSAWTRYEGDVFFPIRSLMVGNKIWIERRLQSILDTTGAGSFRFTDLTPYIKWINGENSELEVSLNYRFDREFFQGELREKSEAYTGYFRWSWRPDPRWSWQSTVSYRTLNVRDSIFESTGLENSRLLNINLQNTFSPRKRWVYANLLYEVNAEQIAKREIRYIRVNPGQGTHIWLDSLFNDDLIPDIEEFQVAPNPLVADYIRVVVPTRELVPATRLNLRGLIRWDFRNVIGKSGSLPKEWLRQTRLITNFRLTQHKNQDNSIGGYLIDLRNPFADSGLVNASYNFRQEISFFQNSPRGDVRLFYSDNQSKLFLLTGDEFRGNRYFGGRSRLNVGWKKNRNKSFDFELRRGTDQIDVPSGPDRSYQINYVGIDPTFNWQASRKFRLSSGYQFRDKVSIDTLPELDINVQLHKLIGEIKWNIKDQNTLNARLELVNVQESSEPSPLVAFQLREGLQPGGNIVWQGFLTWFVLKNVEINFTYDGRVSRNQPVIHTGKLQARAFF